MKVLNYYPIQEKKDADENCIRLAVGFDSGAKKKGYYLYAMPLCHAAEHTESWQDIFTKTGVENRQKLLLAAFPEESESRMNRCLELAEVEEENLLHRVLTVGNYALA